MKKNTMLILLLSIIYCLSAAKFVEIPKMEENLSLDVFKNNENVIKEFSLQRDNQADEIVSFKFENEVWNSDEKFLRFYNSEGQLHQEIKLHFFGVWKFDEMVTYHWNDYGNISYEKHHKYQNENWIDDYEVISTFNDDQILMITKNQWNQDEQEWYTAYMISYTYEDDKLINRLIEEWSEYIDYSAIYSEYTYNSNNQICEVISSNIGQDGISLYSDKVLIEYDEFQNIVDLIWQRWQENDWQNYYKEISTFYENIQESITIKYWQNENWENSIKYIIESDDFSKIVIKQNWGNQNWINSTKHCTYQNSNNDNQLIEYFTWNNSYWLPENRQNFVYDIQDRIQKILREIYFENNWEFDKKIVYSYDLSSSPEENILNKFMINIFPNPLQYHNKAGLSFEITSEYNDPVEISIFNIKGQKIIHQQFIKNNRGKNILNLPKPSNLASGIYFYKVETKKFKKCGKFLIVK
ncbi:MAG: T9SS type A sorting domain-containing protein [Candidatus Cloacimonetes bacterium]|nr:T9SS type A sorting domain-containing protein [Candidatus Cloacimonadota bacterium]